ncbi:AbrB family transcriptional regulator [Metabacillus arenae]|uniref:AbrB family transcriptional regulator n=1 Tax=Metabacillus arenae TaxID=2771434 RepID=A0A926NKS1_9BACI|nr:AbrB family transcriptional regulator [Metabacillus arenae]MBD1381788.1 AbrB family transcriptional regulator [Metabacillus arenae]
MSFLTLEPSSFLSFIVQLALGLMLGLTFSKLDTNEIKRLLGCLVIITVGVFVMTFGVGYVVLSLFTSMERQTVFLATAPGGIAEMSTIAQVLDLNSPIVALLHVMRLLIVLAIFPFILKLFYKKQFGTTKSKATYPRFNRRKFRIKLSIRNVSAT